MKYVRMPIEIESPEEQGYDTIRFNLSESSMRDRKLSDLGLGFDDLLLMYGVHRGAPGLRAQYHPHYYGAFVLDPDGHNIEAVCHRPV